MIRGLRGCNAVLCAILLVASCQRAIQVRVTNPREALIPLDQSDVPRIRDDLDRASLREAISRSLIYLERIPSTRAFRFGPRVVTAVEMRRTLLAFRDLLQRAPDDGEFIREASRRFAWFQAAGSNVFHDVLFTGYYVPILEGSLRPHGPYRYPLYTRPPDLVDIDLGLFRPSLKGILLRGRVEGTRVVPYFSRNDIDLKDVLKGRGLEIVWLKDPVDRFFLHVQGSGKILLEEGGAVFVSYLSSNGRPYRSIGKLLLEQGAVPQEGMSLQAIRAYLYEHPERMDEVLSHNPSYVFFRVMEDGPLGSLNVPLTPGRTIATDTRFFPKGALAYIETEAPSLNGGSGGKKRVISRFVLNQDTGGAIRGAGRVDLFFGFGPEAEKQAGRMRHKGRLYFLLLAED